MAKKSHVVLRGSRRGKDSNATRIGKVNPKEKIELTLSLAGPKLPTADEYVGQTLSLAELAAKYGAKKEDSEKVGKSLKKYGLKVIAVSLETRSMRVSGTARQIEAAFQAGMAMMRSTDDGDYRGREGTLSLPAEIKGIVTGVFGLDQRPVAQRNASGGVSASHGASFSPKSPADLERLYRFPPGDGTGQSIAIAEFGGGYFAADMKAYCKKFQVPKPTVRVVAVDAPAYTLGQARALHPSQRAIVLRQSVEVMMDAEIVAGLCPKAQILVLFSTPDQRGWIDLLNQVITEKPVAFSISWGWAEDGPAWSRSALAAIDDRLNIARLLGITTCVSAGDDGSGARMGDGKAHLLFPSSSPNVLSVGGTMLKKSGVGVKEVTWWKWPGYKPEGCATGGGVSTIFQRPSWQNVKIRSLNPGSIDGRVVPDVAALAGDPWYDLVFRGEPLLQGGTSAAAPVWAALIARIDAKLPEAKRQRHLTPLIYRNGKGGQPLGKAAMRGIASGHNASYHKSRKGYKARVGYDAVTGWGVPDGVKLLEALTGV